MYKQFQPDLLRVTIVDEHDIVQLRAFVKAHDLSAMELLLGREQNGNGLMLVDFGSVQSGCSHVASDCTFAAKWDSIICWICLCQRVNWSKTKVQFVFVICILSR